MVCVTWIMHQQLRGYGVEEKLRRGAGRILLMLSAILFAGAWIRELGSNSA
jgi:hypothetical protein